MTLSRKSQGQGHNSVEVSQLSIKYILGNNTHKQAKVNISVCSLKREVKVKVTKFCIYLE